MQNLNKISEELFAKIRGRFPSVTIGTEEGMITNNPSEARFIEFDYKNRGKVSISLSEDDGLVVMYGADLLDGELESERNEWYNFLKELRVFAKKRMLNFDTRDITKSNLTKRDYNFLAKNNAGDDNMNESKLYGTSRLSYQDVDNARIVIKHTEGINQELAGGRTKKIGSIYIESSDGERFKYPFKHLSGARAMARHVAEGGNPYDDFGKHITGLSEEMSKLRKFKTYMGRSAVMAESLSGYMDVVKERISTVKKTIESLQKQSYYKETFEAFEAPQFDEVPEDVRENWIDELTIKQFNEELADVFPYIYKLVSEATKATELGPEDFIEAHGNDKIYDKCWKGYRKVPGKKRGEKGSCVKEDDEIEAAIEELMGQFAEKSESEAGAEVFHDGTTIYPKVGDKVEVFYTSTDEKPDNAVGVIVGQGEGQQQWKVKFKDNETGEVVTNTYSSHDEFMILDKDRNNPDRIKDREQGELPMPGGQTNRRNVKDPTGEKEGNAYAHAVRQAKMNGKKKGDKVKGPDGDEITLEKEQKTPLGEFILSYYDRETGSFPKGETAVLTMVEKDYGDHYVRPAKAFIEKVHETYVQHERMNQEQNDILALAGI